MINVLVLEEDYFVFHSKCEYCMVLLLGTSIAIVDSLKCSRPCGLFYSFSVDCALPW
jgi:hypothetical protein